MTIFIVRLFLGQRSLCVTEQIEWISHVESDLNCFVNRCGKEPVVPASLDKMNPGLLVRMIEGIVGDDDDRHCQRANQHSRSTGL